MSPRISHKRVHVTTTAGAVDVPLADDFRNRTHVTAQAVCQRIGAVLKWGVA